MMQRLLYYSQVRQERALDFRLAVKENADSLQKDWHKQGLSDVSVFALDAYVCLYAELSEGSIAEGWDWPETYAQYLEQWPADPTLQQSVYRLAVPMIDIFHDGVPKDMQSWRSTRRVEERIGSIARLKPEWVASYIYYHFQKQEEAPDSFNQTYIIGSLGQLLFSYHELPARNSEPKRRGLLNTNQSPDNWHEVMLPHFEPCESALEGQRIWSRMDRVL